MKKRSTNICDLLFEQRDSEIFDIADTKTRLATLQNYFFPRLEFLLRDTLGLIQIIYGVNPYKRMTFVYRPDHRPTARSNKDYKQVHIGLCAKRRMDRPLTITRSDGTPRRLHATYLTYTIDPLGAMCVELLPFRQYFDQRFGGLVRCHLDQLTPLFSLHHISHSRESAFLDFGKAFTRDPPLPFNILLYSPTYYFPLTIDRGLGALQAAFISLYPLLDSFISIGEGEEPRLAEMLSQLQDSYLFDVHPRPMPVSPWLSRGRLRDSGSSDVGPADGPAPVPNDDVRVSLPELESYAFVRAGIWWQVLARDDWKCCSCGRNVKEDGVTLEVDHIVPRSMGGTDDIENLQTLCKKCNIGKSNKDSTDLRAMIMSSKNQQVAKDLA